MCAGAASCVGTTGASDIVAHPCCSVVPPPGQFVDIYCLVSIGLGLAEHIGRFIAVRWRIYKRSRATVSTANRDAASCCLSAPARC